MPFNTQRQFIGSLGHLKMEIGYCISSDITGAGIAAADTSETHAIPTTLRHLVAGWMYSLCDGGAVGFPGCVTGFGSVCAGHASGPAIDFTMDTSVSGVGGDYYLLIGW